MEEREREERGREGGGEQENKGEIVLGGKEIFKRKGEGRKDGGKRKK